MRTRLLSPNRQRAIDYDDGDARVTLLDLEHHWSTASQVVVASAGQKNPAHLCLTPPIERGPGAWRSLSPLLSLTLLITLSLLGHRHQSASDRP
ncbi:MAG: hypothetical protein ACREDR_00995 [Blastocatellia bacterium]